MSIETIRKKFILNYCTTCHSLQGSSIKGKITNFDWNVWCSTREWLYTAITRATDFKNVCFYDDGSEDITEQLLERYLQQKLCKYRKQDRDGGRAIEVANYVDCQGPRSFLGGSCSGCGIELSDWLKKLPRFSAILRPTGLIASWATTNTMSFLLSASPF